MNQDLALKVLSQIMEWSDEQASKEFRWLRLMARLKYDSYRDFRAGMRFIESLATWLQQFKKIDERNTAYDFVRSALVYLGPGEMQRLVEQFYPKFVYSRLVRLVADELSIPQYRVFATGEARDKITRLRRQTLFMGLSEGARMDTIRHTNAGHLSNEQIVGNIQVDLEKWEDLLKKLKLDLDDQSASFRFVYLVDDFTASGSTFLREDANSRWVGKLVRFRDSLTAAVNNLGPILTPNWVLCIHHYVASSKAVSAIQDRISKAQDYFNNEGWTGEIHTTFGTILPTDLPIDTNTSRYDDFIKLTDKYYDPTIETVHTQVGKAPNMALGYAGCALPVVLEHNTPNNSVALLWAETDGINSNGVVAPAMRPLFRRRQRHI